MDESAEKGQSGVDYYQKIIMLVVVYFEQKIKRNVNCNQTDKLQYTLANVASSLMPRC